MGKKDNELLESVKIQVTVEVEVAAMERTYYDLVKLDHDSAMRVIEWVRGTLVRESIARISEHTIGPGPGK